MVRKVAPASADSELSQDDRVGQRSSRSKWQDDAMPSVDTKVVVSLRFTLDHIDSLQKFDLISEPVNFDGRHFSVRLRCLQGAGDSGVPTIYGFLVMRASTRAEAACQLLATWTWHLDDDELPLVTAVTTETVAYDRRPRCASDLSVQSGAVCLAEWSQLTEASWSHQAGEPTTYATVRVALQSE